MDPSTVSQHTPYLWHMSTLCYVYGEFLSDRVKSKFLGDLFCAERKYTADLGGVALVVLVFCVHMSSVVVPVIASYVFSLFLLFTDVLFVVVISVVAAAASGVVVSPGILFFFLFTYL